MLSTPLVSLPTPPAVRGWVPILPTTEQRSRQRKEQTFVQKRVGVCVRTRSHSASEVAKYVVLARDCSTENIPQPNAAESGCCSAARARQHEVSPTPQPSACRSWTG